MHKIYFNFFLLTFLALVARFAVCSGTEENRTDGTSPQTGDGMSEKSSLEKGMEPIFKLLHGFLDTVMPYNFYSQDDSPFKLFLANFISNYFKQENLLQGKQLLYPLSYEQQPGNINFQDGGYPENGQMTVNQ